MVSNSYSWRPSTFKNSIVFFLNAIDRSALNVEFECLRTPLQGLNIFSVLTQRLANLSVKGKFNLVGLAILAAIETIYKFS